MRRTERLCVWARRRQALTWLLPNRSDELVLEAGACMGRVAHAVSPTRMHSTPQLGHRAVCNGKTCRKVAAPLIHPLARSGVGLGRVPSC